MKRRVLPLVCSLLLGFLLVGAAQAGSGDHSVQGDNPQAAALGQRIAETAATFKALGLSMPDISIQLHGSSFPDPHADLAGAGCTLTVSDTLSNRLEVSVTKTAGTCLAAYNQALEAYREMEEQARGKMG